MGGRSSDGDQLNGGEVLDLSGSGGDASCVPVPQYPRLVEFAAGAFVNALGDGRDVPLVCGGATNVGTSGECFAFDKYGSFAWAQVASLGAERAEHAGSVFPDGSFWVTGGIDLDRRYTLTTELWSGGISVPGPQLPLPTGGHCQVTIDDNVVSTDLINREKTLLTHFSFYLRRSHQVLELCKLLLLLLLWGWLLLWGGAV